MVIQNETVPNRPTETRRQHLVLLGAGGDLAWRMLLPSLFFLELDGLLPEDLRLTGVSRTEETREAFVGRLWETLRIQPRTIAAGHAERAWIRFSARLDYAALDATRPEAMAGLKAMIEPDAGASIRASAAWILSTSSARARH